ncbi:uncharacterized protein T551_03392 [Pneumocystis jirovecii RU7]|uniref:Uncharacterized protein n=1 Tax=Pneumocystis jirovecii (strain RU7) TaxID=1408657 RepID=A0A0W4ZEY8_PNEJ7|nr:uncharacterized protein T551_03392 [Pneumocystis jirovecii RU7]KTW26930.1 hypothetical protein T551_03392 [Pneumocystis jirovecii RU7]
MSLDNKCSSVDNKKTKNTIITDFFLPKTCSVSNFSEFSIKDQLVKDNNEEIFNFENELNTEFNFEKSNVEKLKKKSIDPIVSEYCFSLETLLKDQENRKKRYESFNRAQELSKVEVINLDDITSFVGSEVEIALKKEKEKRKELQTVLNETDIFKKQIYWSFFVNEIKKIDLEDISTKEFELQCDMLMLEKDRFSFLLITGYFLDMTDSGDKFSPKFVQWLLDNLCIEENGMLLYGYFSILLKIYSSVFYQMHVLSEFQIKRIFLLLGASSEAIDIQSFIEFENIKNYNNDINNIFFSKIVNLKLVLIFLTNALLHNRIKKRQCILLIFSIILKLYMDQNCALYLSSSLYLCYFQLFNNISNLDFQSIAFDMFSIAYNITKDSFMRLRILQSFPVEHIYGRVLRSTLAFSMLLNTHIPPDNFPDNPNLSFSRILDYIQSSRPFFPIDSNTNYFELCIAIYMLDYILSQSSCQDIQIVEKICKLLKNVDEKILNSRNAFVVRTESGFKGFC